MGRRGLWLAAFLLGTAGAAVSAAAPETPAAAPSCAAPEYRRVDFWIGDWDAYEVGGAAKPVARCRVEAILGGCALRESYEQDDGLRGESFTVYDAARKLWHQSWVTNRGALLTIEGDFQGDALTLRGILRPADGKGPEKTIRGIWRPEKGGVRETAETSADGGTSWQPLFDIHFRPHGKPGP